LYIWNFRLFFMFFCQYKNVKYHFKCIIPKFRNIFNFFTIHLSIHGLQTSGRHVVDNLWRHIYGFLTYTVIRAMLLFWFSKICCFFNCAFEFYFRLFLAMSIFSRKKSIATILLMFIAIVIISINYSDNIQLYSYYWCYYLYNFRN